MSSDTHIQRVTIPVDTLGSDSYELHAAMAPSDTTAAIRGLIFMGLGAESFASYRAAKLAAEKQGLTDVLFVNGLPYFRADPSEEGLKKFAQLSVERVSRTMCILTLRLRKSCIAPGNRKPAWLA